MAEASDTWIENELSKIENLERTDPNRGKRFENMIYYCNFSYKPLLIKYSTGDIQCCEDHKQNVITINCKQDVDKFYQSW